jgi:hypothetical protein
MEVLMRLYHAKPNIVMLAAARREFDHLEDIATRLPDYNITAFDYPHHWIQLAVYDVLGGYAARVSASRDATYERWTTKKWFEQREMAASPAAVVLASLLEGEASHES